MTTRRRPTRSAPVTLNIDGRRYDRPRKQACRSLLLCMRSKFYGQAERAISNGKLNGLPRLHIRPIKQVVYLCPS